MHKPSLEETEIIRSQYKFEDCRSWFYYPIIMPLIDGKGPATEKECDQITWEVWDMFCESYGSFDYLSDAINFAIKLNKELLNN